ncbi:MULTISPECIES: hypothetical protein [unclassified Mesorhizobium]|uniref:hypothetical protein n=1 Tax=Mesorhizobium sp. LNJC395A00 TaxID=1287275 RepID=UPI00067EC61B|nr:MULTISPECIES: hypothetical protein [unclassified Mesorhizobium]WJI76321.1 hypothetical protein NLY37_06320 [Mesorhizobium sp. C395A]
MGKQHLGMGRVQDDEPFQAVRQLCACRPGDDTAPVMTEEVKPSDAERVGDGNDIADELRERVFTDGFRLVTGVVAPLVGNDDPESGGSERIDLPSPADPEVAGSSLSRSSR